MNMGDDRESRLRQEAAALWRALYDAAPPAGADGELLLDAILRACPAVPAYDRLRSPHLRPSQIARPRDDA